jgi:hypothetical protein
MHYAVCDYVLDVFHNSVEAGARHIELHLHENPGDGMLELIVCDDGCGMDRETLARALDPFYSDGRKHPGRRVGLGLPFLQQLLDGTDGEFSISSEPGRGTELSCRFNMRHLDSPPLGNIRDTLMAVFSFPGDHEVLLKRTQGNAGYELRRSDLLQVLGNMDTPQTLDLLTQFLESQEDFHGENDS